VEAAAVAAAAMVAVAVVVVLVGFKMAVGVVAIVEP
jgi:hypothetical protein